MQQPGRTADVIALLDERAAFLRANLAAGCLPSLQQMANFLGNFLLHTIFLHAYSIQTCWHSVIPLAVLLEAQIQPLRSQLACLARSARHL